MALSDKNIVITPNIGSSSDDPKIVFSGADVSTAAQNITLKTYPTSNGTLSFEGSSGQLFSITNSLSGTIFSVNDVSGMPSIEVLDTGLIKLAQYSGNVLLGTATDNGTDKLQVNGSALLSSLTLSGGTANGVLYLNGSKAVTSGSALTFDGTALSISGGTNGNRFNVGGTGAMAGFDTRAAIDGRIEYAYNGTNTFYTGIDSASLFTLMARSGVSLAFGANNTEQMRLTSTGLGIGTSSPAYKLHVNASSITAGVTARFAGATNGIDLYSGSGISYVGDYGLVNGVGFNTTSNYLGFYTNNGERMRLDSAGNLGLGVTPSAWSTGSSIEVGNPYAKISSSGTYGGVFTNNAYYNGGWKYNVANYATMYQTLGGAHSWHTAPAGTAGAAISFTQAMTLDASGNLGIGTISPKGKLTISATSTTLGDQASSAINIGGAGASNEKVQILLGTLSYSNTYAPVSIGYINTNQAGNCAGAITFSTRDVTTDTAPSERMRLDSAGNLGIGVTSPGAKLDVNGSTFLRGALGVYSPTGGAVDSSFLTFGSAALINAASIYSHTDTATAGNLIFATSQSGTGTMTERARIDSAGNLGIGTASPAYKLDVNGTARINNLTTVIAQETATYITASTATTTIDLSLGTVFIVTISSNTTFAFTNIPAGTNMTSFSIITINDATAGRAVSWPAAVTWSGGTLPPRTTTANKSDAWTFFTNNAGTKIVGSLSVTDF